MLKLVPALTLLLLMINGAAAAPVTLLALGDSLTAGYGLQPSDAFPVKLESALRETGLANRVHLLGHCWNVAEWYDAARLEMLRFPAGAHDDQVDSISWMTQMAIGREPPARTKHKEPPSWRDKLNNNRGHGSYMAA